MHDSLTPYGNLVVLLAIVGGATLMTWIITMAEKLFRTAQSRLKKAFLRWEADRALGHALKLASKNRLSDAERCAIREGAQEAIAAFERAQHAVVMARHCGIA